MIHTSLLGRAHFRFFEQAPVLAKRKTKVMKEMEEASAKRAESKGKSAARRANMTQQFVIPDHTTTDYERQLKKIATRGGKAGTFGSDDTFLLTNGERFVTEAVQSVSNRSF